MLEPLSGKCFITPYLPTRQEAVEVEKRSGILIPPPKNTLYNFEGVPNQGEIVALPLDYAGKLKVGDRVVFNEDQPKGFKWGGKVLFGIKLEQIIATVNT